MGLAISVSVSFLFDLCMTKKIRALASKRKVKILHVSGAKEIEKKKDRKVEGILTLNDNIMHA